MARAEEYFKYDSISAPGTPSNLTPGTPMNSEKRIKNGLKKLIPFTKNKSELDKSEKGFGKEEAGGGGSPSRGSHFNLFKRLRSHKHEHGAHTSKNDEPTKPGYNENTQTPSEKNNELHEKDRTRRNDALKEETKPSKHNLHVDTLGEVLNLLEGVKGESQIHFDKQTQATIDGKVKQEVNQELKIVTSEVQEKEVVKHDQLNDHKQNEDRKCDINDEKLVVAFEAVEEQIQDLDSPHPPLLQENDIVEEKYKLKNEALKEETKPSKHNFSTETIGEVLKLFERVEESQNHPHKQTQATIDENGESKEHEELKVVANEVQEKEVIKHDQQNHRKQIEDPKADTRDEKLVVTSEAMEKQTEDISSFTPPPILQEDVVGCESLVKGLQKICLPWTINKEDH